MEMNNEVWTTLLNYESSDFVRKAYEEKHGHDLGLSYAREICSCFVQARSYFKNASEADYSVKPILLHCGVRALGKGLILFSNTTVDELDMPQSPGIVRHDWKGSLEEGLNDYFSLTLQVTPSGLYPLFSKATESLTPLRIDSDAVNYKTKHKIFKNYSLKLGDILARFPDIQNQYMRTERMPGCFSGNMTGEEGAMHITLDKRQQGYFLDADLLEDCFEDIDYYIIDEDKEIFVLEVSVSDYFTIWDCSLKSAGQNEKKFIILPFPKKFELSKPCATYMLSFAIAMLARFYPSKWVSLVHNDEGDDLFPTLVSCLSFIEIHFPQVILDLLEPVNCRINGRGA